MRSRWKNLKQNYKAVANNKKPQLYTIIYENIFKAFFTQISMIQKNNSFKLNL